MSEIVNLNTIIDELNKKIELAYDKGRVAGYQQGKANERAKVIDFILANVGFDCDNCSLRDNCGCDCKQALLEKLKEKSDE